MLSSSPIPSLIDLQHFTDFALNVAVQYLGFGGSSSRAESAIFEAAKSLGIKCEILASPSGIYMTAFSKENPDLRYTEVRRVQDRGFNLKQIEALERILKHLRLGSLKLDEAHKEVIEIGRTPTIYKRSYRLLAGFVLGAGTCFFKDSENNILVAFIAGLLTSLVIYISSTLSKRLHLVGIFGDFLACIVLLLLGTFFSYVMNIPIDKFVFGGLIYLVPGLLIITAVSELSTYNYLSGTAKIMKALIILLSLVISFALISSLLKLLNENLQINLLASSPPTIWSLLAQNLIGTLSFLVLFQVPKKALPGAVLCGLLGFLVLHSFPASSTIVLKTFLASFTVGFVSLAFGYMQQLPSQCFSVPGIYTMLPGLMAFSFFSKSMAILQSESTDTQGYEIVLVAVAIVFGLIMARVPFYRYQTFKELEEEIVTE